nr:O-antigen ligase family protein [Chloroflexota bacterium]
AYVILTSPDLQPRTDTIPLATGLAPGPHIAVIRADRGWDQWAIVAVTVGPSAARPDLRWPLVLLGGVTVACAIGLIISIRKHNRSVSSAQSAFQRFGDPGQTVVTAAVAALLWASAWLTWGNDLAQTARKYGDTAPLLLTLLTAGLFYYSPFLILTLISLTLLFSLFCLRPELALPLIALAAPFYLLPRPLWDRAFSMVEVFTVLAVAATLLRLIPTLPHSHTPTLPRAHTPALLLDLSVAAFVLVSAAGALTADVRGVALRELRVVIVEPALLYLLFRLLRPGPKTLWRTADFFLLGAVLVALIGLGNYVTHTNLITAEGGVARIRSVFGSPNNLGLYLERAFPVAASLALMGRSPLRRALYALATLPIAAAIVLSFSKGALLLGVPAAVAVTLLFWGKRRAAIALAALTGAAGLAIIPLSRNPRFAGLFNLTSGTSFFRVQLWRSALAMWADHPLLGVGPDNFLYAYRGKYILPEAWQEPNLPHAHNFVLDALTRLGLLGLASFAAMLISFFMVGAACSRDDDPDTRALAIGLLAGMVAALAHGLVDTSYWFVDLAFVFMMTLGLMTTLRRAASKD